MTSGDEPRLGGQPADNAPMISSVATRAFVHARGAYLAGNERFLIQAMSAAQELRLRAAIVQQVLVYFQSLPDFNLPEAVVQTVTEWLQHPAVEQTRISLNIIFGIDNPRQRYFCQSLLWLLSEPSTVQVLASSRSLFENILDLDFNTRDSAFQAALQFAVRQWQLDAAWAILQGGEPPPPRPASPADIQAVLSDALAMYRQKNWLALNRLMNEAQAQRFAETLLREAVERAEQVLPPPDQDDGESRFVGAARRVLERQAQRADAAVLQQCSKRDHSPEDYAYYAALYAASAADENPEWYGAGAIALACAAQSGARIGDLKILNSAKEAAEYWRCEVAWAILNGDEPPPLEDQP